MLTTFASVTVVMAIKKMFTQRVGSGSGSVADAVADAFGEAEMCVLAAINLLQPHLSPPPLGLNPDPLGVPCLALSLPLSCTAEPC